MLSSKRVLTYTLQHSNFCNLHYNIIRKNSSFYAFKRSFTLLHKREFASETHRTITQQIRSNYKRIVLFGSVLGSGACILYNWKWLRQRVGQEGAEVLKEGIKSEDLQLTAADFSKALLHEILHDDTLLNTASEWFIQLLRQSESQLGSIVGSVLQTELVTNEAKRLTICVVEQLCGDPYIQTKVAQLLVAAINTPYAKEQAAVWLHSLFQQEDVQHALRMLMVDSILNDPKVNSDAVEVMTEIVAKVLSDPSTIAMSILHLTKVLGEERFQDVASSAVWNVVKKTVVPRWFHIHANAMPSINSSHFEPKPLLNNKTMTWPDNVVEIIDEPSNDKDLLNIQTSKLIERDDDDDDDDNNKTSTTPAATRTVDNTSTIFGNDAASTNQ